MRKFQTNCILVALVVLIPLFISSNLKAQTYSLDVIADLNTPIPMGIGNFFGVVGNASLGGDDVAFGGFGSSGQIGIYAFIGGTYSVIADQNTPIPMGIGNFIAFESPVSLGGGNVAFTALGSSGQRGIYTFMNGTLSKVVDNNTPIPMGSENFEGFGTAKSLGGGDLAFIGFDSLMQEGIYTYIGGTLTKVADTNTAIPMGNGNFSEFLGFASLGGGDVSIRVTGGFDQEGIYTYIDGVLSMVADRNTAVPMGLGNFTTLDVPIPLGGEDLAFFGVDGIRGGGIYAVIGGTLSVVADISTPIPMGSGNFSGFGGLISIGGGLVFRGGGSTGQNGIYAFIDGTLSVIADINTQIPMGSGNFTNFFDPIIHLRSGDVAFLGFDSSGQIGIYAFISGTLSAIVDTDTAIPMGSGSFTDFMNPVSLGGGGDIAFAGFGFQQNGIYTALTDIISLTIVKETDPDGATGFGFTGTGFPASCDLDGSFTLDDDGFEECDLLVGSYKVQETNSQGFTITDIDCVGASSFSETTDSVTIDLMTGENVVCTFTNSGEFPLNLSIAGNGSGTVNINPPDEICEPNCMHILDIDTAVTLTPTPGPFSVFDGITGDAGCGLNLTITEDLNCTATFTLMQFELTVTTSGNGDGSVTGAAGTGDGIDCGNGATNCEDIYNATTMVTLTATPDGDSDFGGWGGACAPAGMNPMAVVNITDAMTCDANFTLKEFIVTVNIEGNGEGTVTSNPAGSIDCPGDCSETFDIHTAVTLTPLADGNSVFAGWSPNCPGGVIDDLTADTTCTATFTLKEFTLNVAKIGTGTGTVTSVPAGINCGADCSEVYDINTVVNLTAMPDLGSNFAGWTGNPDCTDGTVTMNTDILCMAAFNLNIPPPDTADVSVVKSVSPDPVDVGAELTYSFAIQNSGPDTAPEVQLMDILPASLSFVSASAGCANNGGTITCELGSIPNGGSASVTIVVIPTEPGLITNGATVNSSGAIDPSGENNTSTITTEVIGEEEPESLTVEPDSESITTDPGGMISIPVDISNPDTAETNAFIQSRQTLSGVVFTVDIPDGFDIEELITTQGTCDIDTLQCELGDILPGQTVTVVVDAIAPEGEGVFNVSFSVTTSTGQTFTGNATVEVRGGDIVVDVDGEGGGCAVAGPGSVKGMGSLGEILALVLVPFIVILARRFKGRGGRDL